MKPRVRIVIAVIVIALAGGFLYVKTTPRYSIFLLARALHDHNADEALKYIDVDSLTESLARSLLVDDNGQRKTGRDLAAAISMNMPSIKQGLREYLITVIRSHDSGAFMKAQIAPGLPELDIHEIGFFSIVRLHVETEGGTAYVRLKKDGQRARMVKTADGYWKFVGIGPETKGKE